MQEAELSLCRLAQRDSFAAEFETLQKNHLVNKCSPMKWLNSRITKDDVIRVGGRISRSTIPDFAKHPIVLSGKHRIALLLAEYYHRILMHAGPQLMLNTIRQKFWILGARNLVRQVYHRCITCFRHKPVLVQQMTADLPTSRVNPSRPFAVTGLDYCGPIYTKASHRKAVPCKGYIAIFICFSTLAIHLEMVSDLSTPAFIAALRRFVSRRGKVRQLHSDNATNFKGAANKLQLV